MDRGLSIVHYAAASRHLMTGKPKLICGYRLSVNVEVVFWRTIKLVSVYKVINNEAISFVKRLFKMFTKFVTS